MDAAQGAISLFPEELGVLILCDIPDYLVAVFKQIEPCGIALRLKVDLANGGGGIATARQDLSKRGQTGGTGLGLRAKVVIVEAVVSGR